MEPLGVLESGLIAALTFPIAVALARLCLNGVLHLMVAGRGR